MPVVLGTADVVLSKYPQAVRHHPWQPFNPKSPFATWPDSYSPVMCLLYHALDIVILCYIIIIIIIM